MRFDLYEWDVPSMSKALNLKNGKMSKIHFFNVFPFAKKYLRKNES